MAAIEMSMRVDWAKFRPTRQRLWVVAIGWTAISLVTLFAMYAIALSGKSDIVIGGDFLSFYTASQMLAEGELAAAYSKDLFQAKMMALHPTDEILDLTWQYPPTYFFVLAPLSPLPHLGGFALWSTGTFVIFFLTIRNFVRDRLVLFIAVAGPAAFAAYLTGQNGFAIASLYLIAGMFPKSRPILAGVAAGILTLKPHFGLLLPLAYAAAGCWRAFAVAAVTAIMLALASIAVFGADLWRAFFDSMLFIGGRVENAIMPLSKMSTPYSAAIYLGLPGIFAKIAYFAFALFGAGLVWRVWTRCEDAQLRTAALLAAVFLAAPYGYHYDLIILAAAVAFVAMRGMQSGWLRFERFLIAAAALTPLLVGSFAEIHRGVSPGAVSALFVVALVVRRIAHDAPRVLPDFIKAPRIVA